MHSPVGTLTGQLQRWSRERGAHRAFTYADHPAPASRGIHRSLTWRQLDRRARTVAAALHQAAAPGDRAALLLPQGLDYVTAFLGALYAGVVAVPLFTPDLPGHSGRLAAVLDDAEPACVLTTNAALPGVRAFLEQHQQHQPRLITVDVLPDVPDDALLPQPAPPAHSIPAGPPGGPVRRVRGRSSASCSCCTAPTTTTPHGPGRPTSRRSARTTT
jgi:long chain fatty acid CoA FadD26